METMSERDLVFIAAYNPTAFKAMCTMWALELELQKEGKYPLHKSRHIKR
jgi:hypothetical protein